MASIESLLCCSAFIAPPRKIATQTVGDTMAITSNKLYCKPELGSKIGSGTSGVVFFAEVQRSAMSSPELCAVKRMSKGNHNIKYEREIEALTRLRKYEWFVPFIGWCEDAYWIYIGMEYMEFGDLESHLEEKWTEGDTKVVARQLLEGLKVMHENGILHRDLKPMNVFPILLENKSLRIKIGDFGASKRITNDCSTIARTQTGSQGYIAPEILAGLPAGYMHSVDLWSLGCILYRMIVGKVPFTVPDMFLYQVGQVSFPRPELLSEGLSETGVNFIESLIQSDPETRATAELALKSNWVTCEPGLQVTERLVQGFEDRQEKRQYSGTAVPAQALTTTALNFVQLDGSDDV
ncbi:kinase-like domain-containing protein [Trichophaea hybrida]|nr:kinase-like domain-containing protein [Trichophaea hybrida]